MELDFFGYLDLEDHVRLPRRRRNVRDRNDPVNMFDDIDFKRRFRMNKSSFFKLLGLIESDLKFESERNKATSPALQLLVAMEFYACGPFQIVNSDVFGLSQPTISRIVKRVSEAIAKMRKKYIKFPTREETMKSMIGFEKIADFIGVFGVIDGTHIKVKVRRAVKERFRNRKNEITVNCQVVFDDQMKLLNLTARWPGSTHDARVFRESGLENILENGNYPGHLLGDSAYPLKEYLLIPLSDPKTPAEKNYQKRHIKTRNLVERAIGCWKRRFHCLKAGFQIDIDTSITVIIACGVLWNFLKDQNDLFEEDYHQIHQQIQFDDQEPGSSVSLAGKRKQAQIIEVLYQKL